MKKLIIFAVALMLANHILAQSMFTVTHYGINEGLSHKMVKNIEQDSKGYIWLSTWNGINKFDGYTFRDFKSYTQDKIRMGNNRIESINVSSRDNIWVYTYDGLVYLFNPDKEMFEDVFSDHQNKFIKRVKCLKNGITWITTESGDLYRIDENIPNYKDSIRFYGRTIHPYIGDNIYDIFLDSDGDEWIITNKGVTTIGNKKVTSNISFQYIHEVGGSIVLGSSNGYLAQYSANGQITPLLLPTQLKVINRIKEVNNEKLVIITPTEILTYNAKNKSLVSSQLEGNEEFISSERSYADSKGIVWLYATGRKIIRYDSNNNRIERLTYPDFSDIQTINSSTRFFHEDECGQIWLLLREGVFCYYDPATYTIKPAVYNHAGKKRTYTLNGRNHYVDTHRNLWIITRDGIDNLSFRKKDYEWIAASSTDDRNAGLYEEKEVRGIFEDELNRLWLGIKNNKVEIYDKDLNYVGNLTQDGRIVANHNLVFGAGIYCFFKDKENNIWMGSKDKGLFRLRSKNSMNYEVEQYTHSAKDKYSISSNSIYSIVQDSRGGIWIGTFGGGINYIEFYSNNKIRFAHAGNRLKNYPINRCKQVRCISETSDGVLMVGTVGGLVTFSTTFDKLDEVSFFLNICEVDRTDCLSNNDVTNIFQDSRKNIYVAIFSGGIDVISEPQELLSTDIRFHNYNKTNALLSDLSLWVTEDKKGNIWIGSANSFTKFDPATNTFDGFTRDYLKTFFEIGEAVPLIDHSGNLVFGTTNGALRLLLDQIQKSNFCPPIVFTGINIQNKNLTNEYTSFGLDRQLLNPKERNITISFASLDYSNPNAIQYAYRLKDTSNDWIYIDRNRSASFVNLPKGHHIFEVKSTNGDGVWMDNVTSLPIYVIPVFWETKLALIIYILAFVLIIFLIVFIITYILNLRKQVDFEQKLTTLKLKFFTDISHELRTPLTLIANPIDEVINNETLSESGKENMNTAKQNTNRMLRLINQILDFRKIQNNKMKVFIEQINVIPIVERVFENFHGIAAQNQINFSYEANNKSVVLYTDIDKAEKILFNLLSNAFKYTPNGKRITLTTRVEKDDFIIKVQDEGSGFDIRKTDILFKRFETNNDADPNVSSGIGLSLVKELVGLLHGHIEVQSTKDVGSAFTVKLPMSYELFSDDPNAELILSNYNDVENKTEDDQVKEEYENREIRILIIEDNDDLRRLIKNILNKDYKVLEARNGKEGLDITLNMYPDIVVSDIMMPEMDGVEYLDTVKKNHEISHIPIILLTAKSSIEDQVKGMEYGADDYITKPFSSTYLKVKIASLIKQRELLRDYYLTQKGINIQIQPNKEWEPSIPKITNYDDEFITNVIQGIEDNIENPDFKIEALAANLNMSRSVFYRKIKAIIGLSPIDFVKKIRIKRAVQLLETQQFNVAEVAFRSGFTTPQYLSKVFKDMMGCSPTEYMQNHAIKNTP